MKKRIIATILIFAISLNIEAYYNSTKYIKVVDVQGNVKLEVDVKGSNEIQASKKMIQKPARLGDLLFTRDTIITEASSLTAYLQDRILLKIEENSSIYLDNTFDKNGNIVGQPIVGAITSSSQAQQLNKLIDEAIENSKK